MLLATAPTKEKMLKHLKNYYCGDFDFDDSGMITRLSDNKTIKMTYIKTVRGGFHFIGRE